MMDSDLSGWYFLQKIIMKPGCYTKGNYPKILECEQELKDWWGVHASVQVGESEATKINSISMAFKLELNGVHMAHKWSSLYGLGSQKSKTRKLIRVGGNSERKDSGKGSPNSVCSHLWLTHETCLCEQTDCSWREDINKNWSCCTRDSL